MNTQPDMLGIGDATPESLVEQETRDPKAGKWPEELAALAEVLRVTYKRQGLSDQQANDLSSSGALAIGEYRGGRMLYLPCGERLITGLKHIQAWRMWKGNNIEEIAEFLGVTQTRAYGVLAEQRTLHRGKLQGKLFNESRGNAE